MSAPRDPIGEADLDAYVDDQLDVARRIEVEAHLSQRPEAAARVMSDLRTRDELRLALAGSAGMARPATGEAARRLERGLARGRIFGLVQRAAAVALFIGVGWLAHEAVGPVTQVIASTPPPPYVADAVRAHRTTIARAGMDWQAKATRYDPAQIRAETGIVVPALPEGWSVEDVQLYPSQFGPSVEMAIETGRLGTVSLFAVRPGSFDVVEPTTLETEEASAAYFQIGEVAYALVADPGTDELDRAAAGLSATLY